MQEKMSGVTFENVLKEIESRGKNMIMLGCFAERAREQGYFTVAAKLDAIVRQEREHCRVLYRLLENGEEVDTLANLIYCAGELHRSGRRLREEFKSVAESEGFGYIAGIFDEISKVDGRTEEELKAVMSDLKVGKLYAGDRIAKWQCIKCGYFCDSSHAPEICPLCASQKGFFVKR